MTGTKRSNANDSAGEHLVRIPIPREPYTSGVLEALGGDESTIRSPEDVIPAVVAFANGQISPPWITRAHPLSDDDDTLYMVGDVFAGDYDYVDEAAARPLAEEVIESERHFARAALECAAMGVAPLVQWLREKQQEGAITGVRLTPAVNFLRNRLELSWLISGETVSSRDWVLFACALLAANPYEELTDIGHCKLDTCRRFFLIDWKEGNRPRTKYCSPQHRHEYTRLHAAETKRRSRANARERQLQRHRRRPK